MGESKVCGKVNQKPSMYENAVRKPATLHVKIKILSVLNMLPPCV